MQPQTRRVHKPLPCSPFPVRKLIRLTSPLYKRQSSQEFSLSKELLTHCGRDLNVRPETIKLLQENIGSILFDINHSKILFDSPPTVKKIKTKINKWDLMKLKSFLFYRV